ncbi:MAG: replication initiator protein A [Faecalicatena sp.]|uniref:replication initiator protein A n=1 Tax=Faecalicatena sp. TaxID=2005360 RepID=UPI00258BE66B|nr:replication initiator protein A [Faecalicatena sp.]MCI6466800.1 replication initiator protein A [Faecalicatena sp.]MDY5620593.1 replication initiator protein A [Lachnospiraceae bacterium]
METYYMNSGTPLPRYYPLPQFLLDLNISSTSNILYALLLNSANLSQKNAWEDEKGHVYFVYTIEALAADMKKGQTAIKNSLNELSKIGLLERVRAEFGRANHLYIKIPKDVELVSKPPVIESDKRRSVGQKSTSKKARYSPANNYYKTHNYHTRLVSEIDYSFKEERL